MINPTIAIAKVLVVIQLLGTCCVASLVCLGFTSQAVAVDNNRFNVLFISIDDLRPELGCYGSKIAQTPNLDRLASEGVLFSRHYALVPTCGASRFAMLTGRSPANSGVFAGNDAFSSGPTALSKTPLPGAQTMPELFRRSGYHTVCLGKISHSPDGRLYSYNGTGNGAEELPDAWDKLPTPYGPWQRGWGAFFAYEGGRHREDGQGHRDVMEFKAQRDEDLPDGMIANEAIVQLKKAKESGKPFFMGVGFYKPHLPFVATQQDWDAFAGIDIPPPTSPEKPDSRYWHGSSEFYKYNAPFEKTRPLSNDARERSRRAYFACVRYVDRQVGKVLTALTVLGLEKNTVVVVWSDHGWHLGEQQIWGKHSAFERSYRSVLMMRAPTISQSGLQTEALVDATDIYPTLIDVCRPSFQKTEFPLDGKSLLPILSGEGTSVRNAVISFQKNVFSVRTATHRLMVRSNRGQFEDVELYELSGSLDSALNVADTQPDVKSSLLKLLPKIKDNNNIPVHQLTN